MLKVIGVLSIVGIAIAGFAVFNGSIDFNAKVTTQGKQEISKVRNQVAEAIRDGANSVAEKTKGDN